MVSKYKILHDRPECIGCSACASVAPSYWKMDSDGKSDVIGAQKVGEQEILVLEKDFDLNNDAAESCPVNCIHIFEIKADGSENKLI